MLTNAHNVFKLQVQLKLISTWKLPVIIGFSFIFLTNENKESKYEIFDYPMILTKITFCIYRMKIIKMLDAIS